MLTNDHTTSTTNSYLVSLCDVQVCKTIYFFDAALCFVTQDRAYGRLLWLTLLLEFVVQDLKLALLLLQALLCKIDPCRNL